MAIPQALQAAIKPVTLICGHYGVGKTNLSLNLILDLVASKRHVTAIDLDIVNPYFRATEQRALLEKAGVRLVAPRFADAGTSLDIPSLPGSIGPALESATTDSPVVVDVGGDDVGSTALGRFESDMPATGYCMIGVLNKFRNLVQEPNDALHNLQEIEAASRLKLSALISNAHLKQATDKKTILAGYEYAQEVGQLAQLPLVAVTVPDWLEVPEIPAELAYPVKQYVKTPWE